MAKQNDARTYRTGMQSLIALLLAYLVLRPFFDRSFIADFEAYCPLGGMQALSSFLLTDTLACSMTENQIFMGIALLVGVVLFAKLFCSFLCPIGTLSEWLGKIGRKLHCYYSPSGLLDRALRSLKYALLFLTFFFTLRSNELFCKEFDPYFAAFTGFGRDVVLWYALPALLITVVGSVFLRQFWCRYLCPLGAATNLLANAIPVAGVAGIYFLLGALGWKLSWVWLLGAVVVTAALLEIVRLEGWLLPLCKITRRADGCTSCRKCDLACPMGIPVSRLHPVRHIDCHLCGDCLPACPVQGVLQINGRRMAWLPAAATAGLVLAGALLASAVELPTINLRWGSPEETARAATFTMAGLKNIKCFGSSSAFATQMKKVPGIVGVKTFVRTHGVEILYDPNRADSEGIKKAIFTPTRSLLQLPPESLASLSVARLSIEKLFDSYDTFYLTQQLRQAPGIYGLATSFGEPVAAEVYFDPRANSAQGIRKIIEQPELVYRQGDREIRQPLTFRAALAAGSPARTDRAEFIRLFFQPFDMTFNDYENQEAGRLAVYEIDLPQAAEPGARRSLGLLASHLSTDESVVRLETVCRPLPRVRIHFLKGKNGPDSLYQALCQEKLTVHYSDGDTGQVANPFRFPQPGRILDESPDSGSSPSSR